MAITMAVLDGLEFAAGLALAIGLAMCSISREDVFYIYLFMFITIHVRTVFSRRFGHGKSLGFGSGSQNCTELIHVPY